MTQAEFCFCGELNDFLPASKRQVRFAHIFKGRMSVKDRIEALGVPHTEVDRILVNGKPVDFSYLLQDGDCVSVHPVSAGLTTSTVGLPEPPIRFVLDVHLGKLATSLRMLGFDTLYRNDYVDDALARLSSTEGRMLLTRDRRLLMRRVIGHGYYIRETDPRRQLVEVLNRFNLKGAVIPFQRCLRCNGLLEPIDKVVVIERIPPKVRQAIDEFHHCTQCGQIY